MICVENNKELDYMHFCPNTIYYNVILNEFVRIFAYTFIFTEKSH